MSEFSAVRPSQANIAVLQLQKSWGQWNDSKSETLPVTWRNSRKMAMGWWGIKSPSLIVIVAVLFVCLFTWTKMNRRKFVSRFVLFDLKKAFFLTFSMFLILSERRRSTRLLFLFTPPGTIQFSRCGSTPSTIQNQLGHRGYLVRERAKSEQYVCHTVENKKISAIMFKTISKSNWIVWHKLIKFPALTGWGTPTVGQVFLMWRLWQRRPLSGWLDDTRYPTRNSQWP